MLQPAALQVLFEFLPIINESVFGATALRGKAVLIQTNWSRHWNTDRYFEGHPFLTEGAAKHLQKSGARIVGIDSYNIDDIKDGRVRHKQSPGPASLVA